MLSTRFFIGLILLAGGLAGASSVPAGVGWALGLRIESQPSYQPAPERTLVILSRITAKDRVVGKLLAGETGLFEAAAWFRSLNTTPAEYPDEHWKNMPGRCDGEKTCRQVIAWALAHMQERMPSSQIEARMHQWEEELERHIACNGRVVLPGEESGR